MNSAQGPTYGTPEMRRLQRLMVAARIAMSVAIVSATVLASVLFSRYEHLTLDGLQVMGGHLRRACGQIGF